MRQPERIFQHMLVLVCLSVAATSCETAPTTPSWTGRCTEGESVRCACIDGYGYALCGADGIIGQCGCPGNKAQALGAAGQGPAAGGGAFTQAAAGGASIGLPAAAGGSPAPATVPGTPSCAPGETCKISALGGSKFCSRDPAATLPPLCPVAGQACGTNGLGVCQAATAPGYAGMLFCMYPSC